MSTFVAITGEFEKDSQQSEVTEIEGGGIGVGTANVSPEVIKYQPLLEKYAQKHGLDALPSVIQFWRWIYQLCHEKWREIYTRVSDFFFTIAISKGKTYRKLSLC